MNLEIFGGLVGEICAHTLVAPGRALKWTIIANPAAGGFTIRSRWRRHHEILKTYAEKAAACPPRTESGPSLTARESGRGGGLGAYGLIPTLRPGHGGEIARALFDEAAADISGAGGSAPFHLIITAGGDGTSLDILTALYHAPPQVRSNTVILRLPMGTGNDGSDAAELDAALDFLIRPVSIERTPALRLTTSTPGKGPFLAFNILSVGLDAFVTHMTNKTKGKFPGDSYKLWVDIASLLYDRLYRVGPLEVRALDEKKREIRSFRENVLLLAVGASGHRTYGSHKKILPDDRNVCAVKQMPLLRKVALKGLFTTGEHINKPESILFSAHRVEFSGRYPILAQMDGETALLGPEDFPAAIELTEKLIPVLKPR
ncbi:MAG: diacylglycerol kinase [Treponema sp.]|jgi:diacylglycerol kinase family enzyme|nr:diacylglycerol kinase [Treponema sp.]